MISIQTEFKNGIQNYISPYWLNAWIREDKVKRFYRHITREWVNADEYSTRINKVPIEKERRRVS